MFDLSWKEILIFTAVIFITQSAWNVGQDAWLVYSANGTTCVDLIDYINAISLEDCLDYIDDNPDATGQEMVDYYLEYDDRDAELKNLLYEKILP